MKNKNSPIKIKDIAKVANVSAGTVDRVLHNRSDVSEKTRQKVLKIIEELGYKTNIIAKTLASKNQFILSVIIPEDDQYSNYWKKPLVGILKAEEELETFGVKINKYFFNISNISSFETESKLLIQENPNAVILAPIFKDQALRFADKLVDKNIPFILLDSNLEKKNKSIGFVGHDSVQSGMVAAKLIFDRTKNKDNILIINLLANHNNINHLSIRSEGFRSFFAKKDKMGSLIEMNIHDLNAIDINKKLQHVFNDLSQIKGIFVTGSRVHIIAKFLKDQAIDQDIVLVGYDLLAKNIDFLKNDTIDYLISQNPIEQGYQSVMKIFQSAILQEKPDKINYLPIDIIIKENLKYS